MDKNKFIKKLSSPLVVILRQAQRLTQVQFLAALPSTKAQGKLLVALVLNLLKDLSALSFNKFRTSAGACILLFCTPCFGQDQQVVTFISPRSQTCNIE